MLQHQDATFEWQRQKQSDRKRQTSKEAETNHFRIEQEDKEKVASSKRHKRTKKKIEQHDVKEADFEEVIQKDIMKTFGCGSNEIELE